MLIFGSDGLPLATFSNTIILCSITAHKEGHKCRIYITFFLLGSQQNVLLNVYCFYLHIKAVG